MLLSLRYRFLFVHIAKTGGTSVRTALSRYRYNGRYGMLAFAADKLDQLSGHRIGAKFPRHAKAIAAKEMLPREVYEQLFKFVFVRNPWDLQVSSFHHIRRERPQLMGPYHDDFEGFLRWKLDPERPYQYHIDTSIERQSDYIVDLDGNVIVDFIGRYESLNEDYQWICQRIGLANDEPLPHKRQAKDRQNDYRRYYSDATAELVAQHFARDIELFGYSFDGATSPKPRIESTRYVVLPAGD
ncbi:sulfotransferase [Alkalilimnicola ehrlichii]|uniref:Sulfotransferase n=1 Tax=Alkalilimnicola ehrlichii TaxID=351052 RepID=A0A3E0WZY5_9GAMM|nr:sulfotransferase family 2 domain-containing protein [Alkalilimnicola ehrlichii]RFA30109.1 sulfotransferase [Alkalilimnicola ehrlichii]RFA37457.1 sulfotransferase [Alkalilimnicola ehrlichii]